jgi:hypothetical protein
LLRHLQEEGLQPSWLPLLLLYLKTAIKRRLTDS